MSLFGSNTRAIRRAIEVCEAAAAGDFEARVINIDEKGDAARMLNAINLLIDRTDAYVRESRASMEYVSKNKYFRRINERGMAGAYVEAAQTVNAAMQSIEARVGGFAQVVGRFETDMAEVVDVVASAAAELEASAKSMVGLSSEAQNRATAVSSAADSASENVGSIAAATEELTSTSKEISAQIASASANTSGAMEIVDRTNADVAALSDASAKIGEVVSIITEIANQTNLLALNATIEAARAGEAGKGFAVVASEVKALANETARATGDIRSQVSAIQNASGQVVTAMEAIGGTIRELRDLTTMISDQVGTQTEATGDIARNIEMASRSSADVSSSIVTIGDAVGETGAAASEVLTASSELAEKGEFLRTGVSSFIAAVRKIA